MKSRKKSDSEISAPGRLNSIHEFDFGGATTLLSEFSSKIYRIFLLIRRLVRSIDVRLVCD